MSDNQPQVGTKPASLRLLAKCAKAILWKINERQSEVPQWLVSELVVLRSMLDTSAAALPQSTPAEPKGKTPECEHGFDASIPCPKCWGKTIPKVPAEPRIETRWEVWSVDDGTVQVMPNFGRKHELKVGCWCRPHWDTKTKGLLIHECDN